ncbi:hypothetical protein NPX13_g9472 [Xylaria arbuscula]|uniref:Tachykinin family protein n=1 Tax=Xylaria arbuscula TaxID=114810 RepID=A0A9W8THG3_9PEZI|nr:hypothetical protein NPX13_g9472 [Xylaria arbuscula]
MPEFEFVHVDRPGDEKKQSTKIRRHVMKDIGRSRRKSKIKSKKNTAESKSVVGPASGFAGEHHGQLAQIPVASPTEECKLSGIVFPTEMNEERLILARYLFAEARSSYVPFRIPWLSVGLADAASWYITLANTVLFRDMQPGDAKPEFKKDTEAMKLYTMSLQSISRRLADPNEKHKEGLIGAITGFICHDTSTGNFTRQAIHLQGVKSLVDDIGGINEITNPMLRLIISWFDLTGAAYRNTFPLFEIPRDSITNIDTRNDTIYFKMLLESWDRDCPCLGDIHSALLATAAVASYVNRRCHNPEFWRDDVTAARLLLPALHAVLSLKGRALPNDPLEPTYSGVAAREAFRRSLLIFLASLKAKFGVGKVELNRHLRDFREISKIPHVDWSVIPELNLWAHTIAALETGSGQRSRHVSVIVGIMYGAGFTSSQQVLDVVRGVIWVEALFEEKINSLCYEVDSLFASKVIPAI